MSKVTLVVEFKDGEEPRLGARENILGGELVKLSWSDHEEAARERIKNIMLKNWGYIPSCGEDLFQSSIYESDTHSVIDDICEEFNLYESEDDDD